MLAWASAVTLGLWSMTLSVGARRPGARSYGREVAKPRDEASPQRDYAPGAACPPLEDNCGNGREV